jgi:hypothetical protein
MMLACGHDRTVFGPPFCAHMRAFRQPWLNYVKWYTGRGLSTELICVPCAEAREQGRVPLRSNLCAKIVSNMPISDVCDLVKAGGKPQISICAMPF